MAKKKADTYYRSKIDILNYVLNFCTKKYYESGMRFDNEKTFKGGLNGHEAPIGSLCILSSAPFTKWYLSWLLEYKPDEGYGGTFLLKSVEDGSLCNWSNVSVFYLPLSLTDRFPQWKWTDRQYNLWDRWNRAAKRRDAYITLPCMPEFTDDGGVVLSTRERFSLSPYSPKKKFDNWKEVKLKDMLAFYDEAVANKKINYEKENPSQKGS